MLLIISYLIVLRLLVADHVEPKLNTVQDVIAERVLVGIEEVDVRVGEVPRVPANRHCLIWNWVLIPVLKTL